MTTTEIDIVNSCLVKLGAQTISQNEYDNSTNKRARIASEQFHKIRDYVFRQHSWNCLMRRAKLVPHVHTISGATQADPVVLTVADHTFVTGDFARVETVSGMTDINDTVYKLKTPAADECHLYDEDDNSVDGAGFGAYTSGGTLTQVPAWGADYAYKLPDGCLRVIRLTDEEGHGQYDFRIEGDELVTYESEAYIEYIFQDTDPDNWDPVLREMIAIQLAIDIAFNLTQSQELANYIRQAYTQQILPEARSTDAQESKPTIIDDSSWINDR